MDRIIKVPMTWKEFKYLLLTYGDDPVLKPLLEAKLQAMADHDLYTIYKTAKSDQEREAARQQYLDRKGIPADFRW